MAPHVGSLCGRTNSLVWRRAVGVGLVIAVLSLGIGIGGATAGAATGTPSVGITSKTITIGQLADVSGPIPGLFAGAEYGLQAWAAYVNSTGGIDGRKVVIDFKDSALSCTSYTNGITSLATTAFALIGTTSVVDSCGQSVLTANPNLLFAPVITTAYSLLSLPNVVQPVPAPAGSPTAGYVYVKNKYGAKAVQEAGSIYNTGSPAPAGYQRSAAESVGYKYVYVDGIGPVQTEFTSDILRMKSDNIKVVDLGDLAVNQVADFLNQSLQQGFKPLAVISATPYDASFFKLLTSPAAASSLVMPEPFALYLGPNPYSVAEVKTVTKWVNKVKPNWPLDLYTLEAWTDGLFFQAAMSHVSGTPTQQALLAAVKSVTTFNGNGLIPPVNPAKAIPTNCAIFVGSKNNSYVRLAPKSGFECGLGKYYFAKSS
jgi:ABC-type branched-subunit amino acid transport system substrate-binding protein